MAVPKRKTSRSRRDSRRANWKLPRTSVSKCGHCGQAIVPHRICANCGHYGGVEITKVEAE